MNTGGKPLSFTTVSSLSETDFHLQLRFRRNVIAPNIFKKLESNEITIEGWTYQVGTWEGKEDYISLKKDGAATFTMNPVERQFITISEFSASARGGARNTRVEVRFRTNLQNPGSVMRHMEIQNHRGLKSIPLIARVKGSATVLNDGSHENELTLEISYTRSTGSVKLSNDPDARSRFELILDEELFGSATKNNEHASKIIDASCVPTIENKKGEKNQLPVLDEKPKKSGVQITNLAFEANKENLEITGNKPIIIRINNWITNGTNGTHNILLHYKNIPGYWSGTWVIPVELNPLVIKNNQVGIGTDDPKASLHVLHNSTNAFKGHVADLESDVEIAVLRILQNGGAEKQVGINNVEGKMVFFTTPKGKKGGDYRVTILQNGNVGIGTEESKQKLHVEGNTSVSYTHLTLPTKRIV